MRDYDLLISGGEVVVGDKVLAQDIFVKDGKIVQLCSSGEQEEFTVKRKIDAKGKLILPGAIDAHVHFNDPGFEWREDFLHGTKAAVKGGTTTILDMPLQNTPALSTAELFAIKEEKVNPSAYTDYGFWGALLHDNREALPELNEAGVFAFKSFISPVGDDFDSLSYGEIRDRMLVLKEFDGLSGYHCEDYSIIDQLEKAALKSAVDRERYLPARPVSAELIAVEAVIHLAEETGTRVHIVHVSHPEVAEIIKQAKQRGVRVTAETCVHYLVFSNEDLVEQGPKFKCAPPLREKVASEQLWSYLLDGTLDLIVSDHSPCQLDEKQENEEQGIFSPWGGISGVQSTVQVMFNEWVVKRGLPVAKLAALLSGNAATVFELKDKGILAVGKDADLVVIDPNKKWTIEAADLEYKNKFSAFEGLTGTGLPVQSILRGQTVYEEATGFAPQAEGQLLIHD
ncbi:allantoinase AllB [Enterococcus olivae]